MLKITIILICMLIWFSCGGDEQATEPPQTGTISGNIYDSATALPIAATSVSSQPPTSAVTTDTTGAYSISNVEPETYSISASKMGYIANSISVSVSAGNMTVADIFLVKDTVYVNH